MRWREMNDGVVVAPVPVVGFLGWPASDRHGEVELGDDFHAPIIARSVLYLVAHRPPAAVLHQQLQTGAAVNRQAVEEVPHATTVVAALNLAAHREHRAFAVAGMTWAPSRSKRSRCSAFAAA